MPAPHQIVDNFLDDPDAYRAKALAQEYYTIKGPDSAVYHNINMRPTTEFKAEIETALGKKIDQNYSFLRYAIYGSGRGAAVHADSGFSEYALVLYLNPPDQIPEGSGVAFYEHKKLKMERMLDEQEVRALGKSPKRVWETLESSWNDLDAWRETGRVEMKYARAVIYPTVWFHSRLPLDAFGNTLEDARLIFVSFFNVL